MSITVFFDLGDTLVVSVPTPDNSLQLEVLPFVPEVLNKLKQTAAAPRLGVISNSGTESLDNLLTLLRKAELLDFFDQNLLLFSSVEGIDKTHKELFERAVKRAGEPPNRCVYVGEDEAERKVAASANMRTSFHALHVFHVLCLMMKEK